MLTGFIRDKFDVFPLLLKESGYAIGHTGKPYAPRAKATLYDHGVRMPLIVRWDKCVQGGRVVTDPVSLTDWAPTFLELADDRTHQGVLKELRNKLNDYLTANGDPRMNGASPWDNYNLDRPFPISQPKDDE